MERTERTLVLVAGGVLILVIAAVLVVLGMGEAKVTEYPADTPEGVVQRYIQLARAGETDAARAHLSTAARAEIEKHGPSIKTCEFFSGGRITVKDVNISGDKAMVYLRVENPGSGGLFNSQSWWEQSVQLILEDGVWKINEPYFCV